MGNTLRQVSRGGITQLGRTVSTWITGTRLAGLFPSVQQSASVLPLVTDSSGLNRWWLSPTSTSAQVDSVQWNPDVATAAYPLMANEEVSIVSSTGETFRAWFVGRQGFYWTFDIATSGETALGSPVNFTNSNFYRNGWSITRIDGDIIFNAGVDFKNSCVILSGISSNANDILTVDGDGKIVAVAPAQSQGISGVTIQDSGTPEGTPGGVTTINFGGNLSVTPSGSSVTVNAIDTGINGINVENDGTGVGTQNGVTGLNFGAGLTATGTGGAVTITASGAGSNNLVVQDNGVNYNTDGMLVGSGTPDTLNFRRGFELNPDAVDSDIAVIDLGFNIYTGAVTPNQYISTPFVTAPAVQLVGTTIPARTSTSGMAFDELGFVLANDNSVGAGDGILVVGSPFINLYETGTTDTLITQGGPSNTNGPSNYAIRAGSSGTGNRDINIGVRNLRFNGGHFDIAQTAQTQVTDRNGQNPGDVGYIPTFNPPDVTGDYTIELAQNPVQKYTHTQTMASATWSITHNLNDEFPVVTVWERTLDASMIATTRAVLPMEITSTSTNTLTITFPSAVAGVATIIG